MINKSSSELSFTLIETVIALGLLVFVVAQYMTIQGNVAQSGELTRNVTQASWLAKRVMAQVEYYAASKPWTDLKYEAKDVVFEDFPDFKYDIEIKEWKLPILKLLSGGGGEDSDKKDSDTKKADGPPGLEGILKQVLGDDLLKIAHVTVYWPDGAQRSSIELGYLLVNQQKLDETIMTMKTVADAATAGAPTTGGNTAGSPPATPGTATSSGAQTTGGASTSGTATTGGAPAPPGGGLTGGTSVTGGAN